MNSKERYFYFGETDIATTGEACMFPLSSFLGMTPAASNRINVEFKSRNGAATNDSAQFILQTGATTKEAMSAMVDLFQSQKGFVKVIDGEAGINANGHIFRTVGVGTEA